MSLCPNIFLRRARGTHHCDASVVAPVEFVSGREGRNVMVPASAPCSNLQTPWRTVEDRRTDDAIMLCCRGSAH